VLGTGIHRCADVTLCGSSARPRGGRDEWTLNDEHLSASGYFVTTAAGPAFVGEQGRGLS